MKHLKLFEEYKNKYHKSDIKDFMKKYPKGTIFTFEGGYKFKINEFDPYMDNGVIGSLYSPSGRLIDENNTKNHDAIIEFLDYNWRVINQPVKENLLPKPYKKVKCLECGEEVCDNLNYKIGHLYNKHNCKPSVGDYKAKKMMKEYFN